MTTNALLVTALLREVHGDDVEVTRDLVLELMHDGIRECYWSDVLIAARWLLDHDGQATVEDTDDAE